MLLLCTESGSLGLEEEEGLSGRHVLRIAAWSGKGEAGSPVTPGDPGSDRRLNLEHTFSFTRETSPYLVKTLQEVFSHEPRPKAKRTFTSPGKKSVDSI